MPDPASSPALAGGVLTVELGAIVRNWRRLAQAASGAACAAVVKADAYGLGAARVGPALRDAGCTTFFVAHADEGLALRGALGPGPLVAVLHGCPPGGEDAFLAGDLVPVLSSVEQVAAWAALSRPAGHARPAILQVDSGMSRFGLAPGDLAALAGDGLAGIDLSFVMSHLACADEPDHPANAAQLAAFRSALSLFPGVPASLAASSGIFLGPDYGFDLVRPGAALYGVNPIPGRPNPMEPVVRLDVRIVQTRDVPAGTPVGYGWTERTAGPARLATVSAGYADGLFRALSGRGSAWADGVRLPFAGRVSMDSIILDISGLPPGALRAGDTVELIGPRQGVDHLAQDAGTIGYEILTALGGRYHRVYRDA